MGLKWFKTRGSRDGFFRSGCTRAFLKLEGKTPEDRERFMIDKMEGATVSRISFRKGVGIKSKGQEDDFISITVARSVCR